MKSGFYISNSLGLAFRRLAILDLSPAGHQPMSDEAQQIWVIFNGEIYNFRELRQELEALGHRFRSQCDTEVIVRGYVEWGEDVLDRLNGMFGLAIWDEPKRKLVLARDAMGIKPLYYAVQGGSLAFASEIRPVVLAMGRSAQADPLALSLFPSLPLYPGAIHCLLRSSGNLLQAKNSRWRMVASSFAAGTILSRRHFPGSLRMRKPPRHCSISIRKQSNGT